jgi:hypothetical protein
MKQQLAPFRVGPLVVVIGTPSFQHGSSVRERAEQGLVEQFVAQAPDEGLGKGVERPVVIRPLGTRNSFHTIVSAIG